MKYRVTLNGKVYEVVVERGEAILADEYDTAMPPPAAAASAPPGPATHADAADPASGEVISAPLPGTVLKINVSQGEPVRAGQVLAIIEAMKMENEIMAHRDGIIVQIAAKLGATLNTGDPLVVLGKGV